MAQTLIKIPYKPRGAFLPLHNRKQRWAVVVAHRRAGKTVACINELIKSALTFKGNDGRFAYVAPFYRQAKSVAWDYLKRFSAVVPGIEINESELRIDYPNGCRITLFGADNADALRGLFFDGVVADEYGDWKPSVWGYVIRPALADRQGWAVIIGTPKGRNQFWEIYAAACNLSDWLALTIRASESGLLPASEIAALKLELSDDAWRQEMECDFDAALPGAIWGKELWQLEQDGRFTSVLHNPAYPVYTAWDIGRSDDTVIWWYQSIGNQIRVIDYHASSLKDVAFYAKELLGIEVRIDFINDELVVHKGAPAPGLEHRTQYKYAKHWLPHDAKSKTLSAKKSVIQQLAAVVGINTCDIVPDLSVQDGIQAVRVLLATTWFDLQCDPGYQALKQYQREYDEDKKCFRDKPRHDWTSHTADALRMLAVSFQGDAAPKPPPDAMRGVSVGNNTATLDDLWKESPNRNKRARI